MWGHLEVISEDNSDSVFTPTADDLFGVLRSCLDPCMVSLSEDGSLAAILVQLHHIRIYDIENHCLNTKIGSLSCASLVSAILFEQKTHPKLLYSGHEDGCVRIWSLLTSTLVFAFDTNRSTILDAKLVSGGNLFTMSHDSGDIWAIDARPVRKADGLSINFTASVDSCIYSPELDILALLGSKTCIFYNLTDGARKTKTLIRNDSILGSCFCNNFFVAMFMSGFVETRHIPTWTFVHKVCVPGFRSELTVRSMTMYSPNKICIICDSPRIWFYDVTTNTSNVVRMTRSTNYLHLSARMTSSGCIIASSQFGTKLSSHRFIPERLETVAAKQLRKDSTFDIDELPRPLRILLHQSKKQPAQLLSDEVPE